MEEIKEIKEFKVLTVSTNRNSFGLRQMIVVAEDGEAYATCTGHLYDKDEGEIVYGSKSDGHIYFIGHELTEKLAYVPTDLIEKLWK